MSPKTLLNLAACFLIVSQGACATDTNPPSAAITRPTANATLSGTVPSVTVNAGDNVGVTSVSLKVDGATVASLTNPPFTFSLNTYGLANGMHTLLAVATDANGNFTRSAVVPVTINNPRVYSPGPGPFAVEDLGPLLSANSQEKQIMFRDSAGDVHLVLYYRVEDFGRYPMQILDINLTRGTAFMTDSVPGRPGSNATALHPNGKIYLGSSDPGYLFEYDPRSHSTNLIAQLVPSRFAIVLEISDNGWVYVGEYSPQGGGLARYNPTTREFQDFGLVDTNFNAPQYCVTVGADSRYAFAGLGQMPWYLGVYDTQTRSAMTYWRTNGDSYGEVLHGNNGMWYYQRRTGSVDKYYILTNGQPVEVASSSVPEHTSIWKNTGNVVCDPASFATYFNTEIDLHDAYPDSGNSNRAIIRWRATGASSWRSVETTGFRIQPFSVGRLYSWNNEKLFGAANVYGPVFFYNISNNTATILGRPLIEMYSALFEHNRVYLSGYTAVTLAYDPTRPWTYTGSTTNTWDISVNPYKIGLALGKYHFFSAFGADGLFYASSMHIRDSIGGDIGWYDPLGKTNGVLRAPFLEQGPNDLRSVLGGTKLVYASWPWYPSSGPPSLYVFDVATKRIERTITPLPRASQLDKIVEVGPGIVFGATGSNIFKVDIRTGAILYTNSVPGEALHAAWSAHEYDHSLVLGPDGYVWMFIGNSLYRVNPEDCSLVKIIDTPARSLMFHNGDLYLYGGPNLYRVRGALISARPDPPGQPVVTGR